MVGITDGGWGVGEAWGWGGGVGKNYFASASLKSTSKNTDEKQSQICLTGLECCREYHFKCAF